MFLKRKRSKSGKFSRFSFEISPEEIFLDQLAKKREVLEQRQIEVPLNKGIIVFVFLIISFVILLFWFQAFKIQIVNYHDYLSQAEANYQRIYIETSERGVIYDTNLNQLVFNEIGFGLVCKKNDLPQKAEEREKILKEMSEILATSTEELSTLIFSNDEEDVLVVADIKPELFVILEERIDDFPGFFLKKKNKRTYPFKEKLSHVLGFLRKIEKEEMEKFTSYSSADYIGKTGLERFYESILRGRPRKILVIKDVKGKEIRKEEISSSEAGKSLVLYLDAQLQEISYQVLKKAIENSGAKGGAVVILDPNSGGVLAMVSLPSFDNNIFSTTISPQKWKEIIHDPSHPFWNRAISGTYPTGSTIKPLIALAALEEGIIDPSQTIDCRGFISVDNPWFPDKPWIFHDWKVHGIVNMYKAIAESCNVYFYTLGGGYGEIKGLGIERIKKYLQLFNWGKLTGIDLEEEKQGLVPDKEWKKNHFKEKANQIWLPGDTYNLSIGQGYLSITPLQVATSFVPLANGGTLYKPQLVKAIVKGSKENLEIIQEIAPVIIRKDFIKKENIEAVRKGMREAVVYGSAKILNSLPITSAAKTGTAQTGKKDYYHNWVTVFAPYKNPELVITVLIEEVPKEQVVALPVAKEILENYFSQE